MSVSKILSGLLYGLAGSGIFHNAYLPLPWMLGPAFGLMISNVIRPGQTEWPRKWNDLAIVIIAFLLGQMMTIEMARSIASDLPWMMISGFSWMLVCFFVGMIFARSGCIPEIDGILGCVPGGLT